MKILAIIPARGGSKRIKQKNIKDFHGKPLIAWAIKAALKSKSIDKVVVTSEDKKIVKIAKKFGAEVPFLRPKHLAKDNTAIEPVLINTLEWLKKHENYKPDAIVLIFPTNPLKTAYHLDEAIKLFKEKKADSVISVSEAIGNNNPYWILKKTKSGKVVFFNNTSLKKIITRSQDLPKTYSRNDIIYVLKPKNLYEKPSNLYGNKIELYVMDKLFDGDINTQEDWDICLHKFKKINQQKK